MTMAVAAADDLLKFLVYVSYDGMVASSAFSRTTLFMRIESIGLPIVWVRSDCLVPWWLTSLQLHPVSSHLDLQGEQLWSACIPLVVTQKCEPASFLAFLDFPHNGDTGCRPKRVLP